MGGYPSPTRNVLTLLGQCLVGGIVYPSPTRNALILSDQSLLGGVQAIIAQLVIPRILDIY
jgi:hypothetical protein